MNIMKPAVILIHERSTAREGWWALFTITYTVVGMIAFYCYFFSWLWTADPWIVIAAFAILAAVAVGVATYGIINIRAGDVFRCRLDEHTLTCSCPVRGCGESFSVSLDDISEIEKDDRSDTTAWYIRNRSGQRYPLTTNYGNPAARFVEELRKLRPEIEIVTR